jgi:membrane-associated protein
MERFVEQLLDEVATAGTGWLLVAAFLLAFGETAFLMDLFVPGEVGLVIVGAAGARNGDSVILLVVAAAIGATLGDSVGWVIGRYGARWLLERWTWAHRRTNRQLTQARSYFERRGGGAVFFGRFVGAIRAVVSVVAGMSGMHYWRFLLWNVLASIAWTGLVISAGYFFGENADSLVADIALIVTLALGISLLLWAALRRLRNSEPSTTYERSGTTN